MRTDEGADELVGRSGAMTELRDRIEELADLPSTVLVTGETGTGKGVVARRLHRLSKRAAKPFVHVDCAALPSSLIESELFGHERGSFTGALARRVGHFERSGEGTLFLDEIGDLDLHLQVKLLRVLQERTFERIGGSSPMRLSARVIAATNAPLERAVEVGRFRRDLYHRLDVIRIRLPPLRERPEDLPDLILHGIGQIAARLELPVPSLSPAVLSLLAARSWPGNIRELWNVLERAVIFGRADRLELADPPGVCTSDIEEAQRSLPGGPPEALRIGAELKLSGGNVSRAARRLGLARSTLRRRIHRYGLSDLIPRD